MKAHRREFLSTATRAAGALAFPTIIPASALGKDGRPAPSERMVMGAIGCGNNGLNWLPRFLKDPRVQVVAVCDVNTESDAYWANRVGGREPGRRMVDKQYGNTDCATFVDYRELLQRDDIDAVQVATPDHWHALQVVAAAEAGKHIYGQKPLSLTIEEGRAMVAAVEKAGVTWQTGSQQRSDMRMRLACEHVLNGRLGKIKEVKVGLPGGTPDYSKRASETAPMEVPKGLDYNLWLGPAPEKPYCTARLHVNWRWLFDYSGGQLTDWGAHHIDIALWGLNREKTGPVEIRKAEAEWPAEGEFYETATKYHFEAVYDDGLVLSVGDGSRNKGGVTFVGEKGTIHTNRGSVSSDPIDLIKQKIEEGEIHLPVSSNHVQNFIDGVFSGEAPIAPIESAHRAISIAHLGNIAMRLGRDGLKWDPAAEKLIGDDDGKATAMLGPKMRDPWSL